MSNTTNKFYQRAEFLALGAAIINGSIGIITRFGFDDGASPSALAFWKCFVAFLLVSACCAWRAPLRQQTIALGKQAPKFALLAFLGIFCLYFFETQAFFAASIPLVAFLGYAAGGFTILLAAIFLGERLNLYKILAFITIIIGVGVMFLFEKDVSGSTTGIIFALTAGLGYALFIFLAKWFGIGSGLPQLLWLFGFGSIYLAFPMLAEGFSYPTGVSLLVVLTLVLLPTIGGFLLTTKALATGEASKVQIIETSDPLFATLFAFLVFGDKLGAVGTLGAALIMAGLLLSLKRKA
ncbi:EamA family transporter [Moraxella caviae]|uniref:EamA family transporter n=1 Tax=Moraxella caviae TaxID=34060 RepID=A0A1T0A5L7_9GAMM|nr:DMT family transporter [Moraxella caviae]OOR91082.1 EamA family transporter [Moraxella caviae]STZ14223.1 Predicted permease, DMT superfamily [Moraxella caviae]VEW13159.1 Predicted permease, DMT superfamily [Moraxella caviae]